MSINRFFHVTGFIIAGIIVIGVIAVVAEEFNRQSSRTGDPPNISGVYIFKKENCSLNGCFPGANPKFTIGYLQFLSGEERVYISQNTSGITINHAGWQSKPMEMKLLRNDPGLGWNNKEFTYKWTEWAAQFGVGRESKMLHLYLDDSKSLIIKTTNNRAGLALYFIPFTESEVYQVKLVRVEAS
jgi:hypothetical protein